MSEEKTSMPMPGMPMPGSEPVPVESSDSGSKDLMPPSHEADGESAGAEQEAQAPVELKKGIEVIAERSGFYGGFRVSPGSEFVVHDIEVEDVVGRKKVIKAFDRLGEWMKCKDAVMQEKHAERIKAKKIAAAGI